MTNYSDPWREKEARAQRAERVVNYMEEHFPKEIEESIYRTIHFLPGNMKPIFDLQNNPNAKLPEIEVVQEETVPAAFNGQGKVAVLNFASYKDPGGMFLKGSMAQEESLCHKSNLYPILNSGQLMYDFYIPNRQRLNRGLYGDNLLWIPDVVFIHNKKVRKLDVITAAAPNKGAAQKYCNVSDEECAEAMASRIRHILFAAMQNKADTLILGAFGCGVFKNDPKEVAEIFKRELKGYPIKTVFAVPGEKYTIFRQILLG